MLKLTSGLLLAASIIMVSSVQAQELQIRANEKGKVGYVDKAGTEVIKCQYETAYPFENGYAIVGKGNKYGIIDATGKEVLPLKYTSISKWSADVYQIKSGNEFGLAKKTGEIILKPDYKLITSPNCYGKEKVNRLKEVEPNRNDYHLTAYGDSRGDKEMFAFADTYYKV